MRRKTLGRLLLAVAILVGAGLAWLIVGRLTAPTIDGISCAATEELTYHVHAHVAVDYGGQQYTPPGNIGISLLHLCLYWVHTHNDSGIIHIEAPHRFVPTLGNFFDIWGVPLSRTTVWKYAVGAGQSMRVYVGNSLYPGNPRAIRLLPHTIVTIEVGPPFLPVQPVHWNGF